MSFLTIQYLFWVYILSFVTMFDAKLRTVFQFRTDCVGMNKRLLGLYHHNTFFHESNSYIPETFKIKSKIPETYIIVSKDLF